MSDLNDLIASYKMDCKVNKITMPVLRAMVADSVSYDRVEKASRSEWEAVASTEWKNGCVILKSGNYYKGFYNNKACALFLASVMTSLLDFKSEVIEFNTGRGYSADGQIIRAQVISKKPDTFMTGYLTMVVNFTDTTRGIRGQVELRLVTDGIDTLQADIMREYDNGRYVHIQEEV